MTKIRHVSTPCPECIGTGCKDCDFLGEIVVSLPVHEREERKTPATEEEKE